MVLCSCYSFLTNLDFFSNKILNFRSGFFTPQSDERLNDDLPNNFDFPLIFLIYFKCSKIFYYTFLAQNFQRENIWKKYAYKQSCSLGFRLPDATFLCHPFKRFPKTEKYNVELNLFHLSYQKCSDKNKRYKENLPISEI